MGGCQSLYYEDEDDKRIRIQHKQHANELRHFQQQLRKQKYHSELDIATGKARIKIQVPPTSEQIRVASNIIYDA